ncbi:MAG TPA: TetR/AcrR family transcriptional regulator [Actinomycetes bacterium]|nr:TetR/AcrR family transcriptional regulator [Actinomycetes bacterium]
MTEEAAEASPPPGQRWGRRHPGRRSQHERHRGPGARRGRPRSETAEAAIIEATLDLLADEGVNALSVEAVAAKAGVGKATIYRRWASKDDLVGDALATMIDDMPVRFAGLTVREQLVSLLEHVRCKTLESRAGRIFPRMAAYKHSHPELYVIFAERVLEPRRDRVRDLVQRGVDAGELRADLDVSLAATLVLAPMLYLNMIGASQRLDEATSTGLVTMALDGISRRP